MWVEQAIFTSLPRHGRGGYHLVSRSKGVSGQEAQAISRWSPSHGSLLQDQSNRVSVNFFSLPGGQFALSRSCEGPPEYSGRGGRQLYTHILIIDSKNLEAVGRAAVRHLPQRPGTRTPLLSDQPCRAARAHRAAWLPRRARPCGLARSCQEAWPSSSGTAARPPARRPAGAVLVRRRSRRSGRVPDRLARLRCSPQDQLRHQPPALIRSPICPVARGQSQAATLINCRSECFRLP